MVLAANRCEIVEVTGELVNVQIIAEVDYNLLDIFRVDIFFLRGS